MKKETGCREVREGLGRRKEKLGRRKKKGREGEGEGYTLEDLLYIEPVRHAETKMVAWLWEQCDNRYRTGSTQ